MENVTTMGHKDERKKKQKNKKMLITEITMYI